MRFTELPLSRYSMRPIFDQSPSRFHLRELEKPRNLLISKERNHHLIVKLSFGKLHSGFLVLEHHFKPEDWLKGIGRSNRGMFQYDGNALLTVMHTIRHNEMNASQNHHDSCQSTDPSNRTDRA